MRPIVNVPDEDRAADMGNMHKKFGKDRACNIGDILADRQTHRQTYSILRNRSRGQVTNRTACTSMYSCSILLFRPRERLRSTVMRMSVCVSVSATFHKINNSYSSLYNKSTTNRTRHRASEYKHVLANISRSRCNARALWTKWNCLVADNVAHAAGESILSLVRACVRT